MGLPPDGPQFQQRDVEEVRHHRPSHIHTGKTAAIALALALGACATTPPSRPRPTDADPLFIQAEAEFVAGRFADAADHFREFLDRDPVTPARHKARHFLGRACLGLDRVDEAISEFERLIAEGPEPETSLRAHEGLARARFARGEWDAACAAARAVADADAALRDRAVWTDEILFFAGTVAARAGLWEESARWFHELLRRGPGKHQERTRIRTELLKEGQFALQLGVFEDRARADAHLKRLRDAGVRAALKSVAAGPRLKYVLLSGDFYSYEEAELAAAALRARDIDAIALP